MALLTEGKSLPALRASGWMARAAILFPARLAGRMGFRSYQVQRFIAHGKYAGRAISVLAERAFELASNWVPIEMEPALFLSALYD